MDRISALLWDVDGTLTDSTALIADALDHIYTKFFHRTLDYDERRALIGTPLKRQIRVFGEPEDFGIREEQIIAEFIGFYEANRARERILDSVIAILKEGKQFGIPTGLVTSKNVEELTNTLPRLQIADSIDTAVTADDIAHPKPAPDGMLLALDRLMIPRAESDSVYYIGDTVHDMQAARQAGVRPIGVAWGAAGRIRLEREHPYYVAETPDDLRRLLFTGSV